MTTTVPHLKSARRLDIGACIAIFLYTLILCVPAAFRFDGVSLYDEITHFDYAYKLTVEHHIPRSVEPLSDEALEAWACRDSGWMEETSTICERTEAGESTRYEFPVDGVNYNGFHPVGYYAITGWGAQILTFLASPFGGMSLFSAMRIMSGLWLAAGASAFYLVLKNWVGRHSLALAATAVLVSTPAVTLFGFTINPDGASLLAGSAALWMAWKMSTGHRIFWCSLLLTFLVASTKLLSIVAILAVVSVGLLYSLRYIKNPRSSEFRQFAGPFAGALLGTVISYVGAALVTRMAGTPVVDNPAKGLSTEPLTNGAFHPIMEVVATRMGLVDPYWMPSDLDSPEWAAYSRLLALLVIAIPFVLMWMSRVERPAFTLGFATVAGAFTVPILVQVREILLQGEYFVSVAVRYSITLIPLAIAAIAVYAHSRSWGPRAMWFLAGLSVVLALGSINNLFTM